MMWDKKRKSIVLILIILFFIILSSIFLIKEAHHDCTGDDCPICATIVQSQKMVHSVRIQPVIPILVFVSFILVTNFLLQYSIYIFQETLITKKIRFND